MARTEFYDDNANRRYPFVSTPAIEAAAADDQLPNEVLLDCGFTFAAYAGATAATQVWLASVELLTGPDRIRLTFATDAEHLAAVPLVIDAPVGAEEFVAAFGESSGNSDAPAAVASCEQLLWFGFAVVTNRTAALAAFIGANGTALTPAQHVVEPALLQNIDGTYVRTLNIANQDRLHVTDTPGEPRAVIVAETCLQGPLLLREGYNCRISADLRRNGFIIAAGLGAGLGQPCDEIPLYVSEASPDDGDLLSGGPSCAEVLKSINGVAGPNIPLRGVDGIFVTHDPDVTNRLIIVVDQTRLARCDTTQ